MRRSGPLAALAALLMSLALAGQSLGVTWSTAVKVSDAPTDYLMIDRSLATAAGVTHLVYSAYYDGYLHYRRSTNLGASWAADVRISPVSDTVQVESAAVAAYGDTVVVAYRTRSTADANVLYVKRSLDKGLHWEPRQSIASYTAEVARMGAPSIAMSSSGIHVVWTDQRSGKVYYRRSVDGGSTFLARVELGVTTITWREAWPSVAASGQKVYVAWAPAGSTTCGASSLVMRRSTDGGASFRDLQVVDSRPYDGMSALAASGSLLLATYTLCDPGRAAVARSGDGGVSFVKRTIATGSPDIVVWAGDVWVSGTRAGVVYVSYTDTTSRLRLRTSDDGGATWIAASTAATRDGIDGPQVVGSSTAVLVAYQSWNASGQSNGIFTRKGVP